MAHTKTTARPRSGAQKRAASAAVVDSTPPTAAPLAPLARPYEAKYPPDRFRGDALKIRLELDMMEGEAASLLQGVEAEHARPEKPRVPKKPATRAGARARRDRRADLAGAAAYMRRALAAVVACRKALDSDDAPAAALAALLASTHLSTGHFLAYRINAQELGQDQIDRLDPSAAGVASGEKKRAKNPAIWARWDALEPRPGSIRSAAEILAPDPSQVRQYERILASRYKTKHP